MKPVRLIDTASRHFDGGSWDAAAWPLAVFLRWAAQRGLAAAQVPPEPARQGVEPWIRHILDQVDGKLTTEELGESAGVFALAIWDTHLRVLTDDESAHERWLDDRWAEHCASLGEPTTSASTSTQEALVTLLKDIAIPHGIADDPLARLADAWSRDPVAQHVFNKTQPRATRKRFAVDRDGVRFGGTAWTDAAANTSPLDVDLDELIETLGAEAAVWLVDALTRTPGAALLDPPLRGLTLRALVQAQLAVRILEPGDATFPEHALVSLGDHGRAVRRVLAAGGRPPTGGMRMIPLVRALHVQVPFEARRWAANPTFASALRRSERWFPDAELPTQVRLLAGLAVRELALLGQSPLAASDAPTLRLLRSDDREGSAVLTATLDPRPAAIVTDRSNDGALRTRGLPCDADALRRAFHALPVEPSLAHDAPTFLVELREDGAHHVRIPSEGDVKTRFAFG